MAKKNSIIILLGAALLVLLGIFSFQYYKQIAKQQAAAPEVKGTLDTQFTGYIPTNYQSIGVPQDILMLPDNSYWYVDSQNSRIVKVTADGVVDRPVGRAGTEQGEFAEPLTSITLDTSTANPHIPGDFGDLYVLTTCHIYQLDFNGGYKGGFGTCGNDEGQLSGAHSIRYRATDDTLFVSSSDNHRIIQFSKTGSFVAQIGSGNSESTDGNFNNPYGLAIDNSGKIYVVDCNNHRVEIFNTDLTFDTKFGSLGTGNSEFTFPKGIAITSNGHIIVASQNSRTIQEFTSEGSFVNRWGEPGTEAWQFLAPQYVALDSHNNVFVSDWMLDTIQKFSLTGTLQGAVRNSGKTNGRFSSPVSLSYDSHKNLFVLDDGAYGARVQKFSNGGTYLSTPLPTGNIPGIACWNVLIGPADRIYVSCQQNVFVFNSDGSPYKTIGEAGTGDGQFVEARGMAFDSTGNLYVADMFNHRIEKFDTDGNYVDQWGTLGIGNSQFVGPRELYMSSTNILYVGEGELDADHNGGFDHPARIQKFDVSGGNHDYAGTIGSYGTNPGQFLVINGITMDADHNLWVSDRDQHKLQEFNTSDAYVGYIGSYGSGIEQFTGPEGITLNPTTLTLSIADTSNHRVELLRTGAQILNLISTVDVLKSADKLSLTQNTVDPSSAGANNITSGLYSGDYIVSDFKVNLTADRDWSNVRANILPSESKSLLINLNPTTAPGLSSTHALYIVKQAGQTSVHICPDAIHIEDVTVDCSNGYNLASTASNVSTVTVDGIQYWKITGLTGTGGLSLPIGGGLLTPTPTPTSSVTTTPKPTVKPTTTPKVTTTPKPTDLIVDVVTLPPVKSTSNACPEFRVFDTSSTLLKKGSSVTFSWTAINTAVVETAAAAKDLSPVDSLTLLPEETRTYVFTADNGRCTATKTVTVSVVDSLPWETALIVGTGALGIEAITAIAQPMIFGNLWMAAGAFIDRRKKRSWGFVYDSTTKKPVSQAVVRLFDATTNNIVQTTVSEGDGVFRIMPKIGSFTLRVYHAQYSFPSKVITGDKDGGYMGIYHGEQIKVTNPNTPVMISVPLDPMNLSAKEKAAVKRKAFFEQAINSLSTLVMLLGLGYSVYAALLYPHIINYLVIGLYLILLASKIGVSFAQPKVTGRVTNVKGQPMAGVELGLFDTDFKTIVYRTFTAADGTYGFAVVNNDYVLKVLDNRYTLVAGGEAVSEKKVPKSPQHDTVRLIAEDLKLKEL